MKVSIVFDGDNMTLDARGGDNRHVANAEILKALGPVLKISDVWSLPHEHPEGAAVEEHAHAHANGVVHSH